MKLKFLNDFKKLKVTLSLVFCEAFEKKILN